MRKEFFPKITIMIPTYNQESYIAQSIESALAQDYINLEIVVSDDCSTDGTANIVKPYLSNSKVKYFRNEINLGRIGNYHKTLYDYATGEWVVNLDGDDYYTDNHFISYVVSLINTYKDSNVVAIWTSQYSYTKTLKFFPHNTKQENVLLLTGIEYFLKYPQIGFFPHFGFVYKRDLARDIDFYTFNSLNSDFHSGVRLILRGNILLINKEVAYWRIHANNASVIDYTTKLTQSINALIDIAQDASIFIDKNKTEYWLSKMIKQEKESYILSIASNEKSLKAFFEVLSKPMFSRIYFISLIKMFMRVLRIKTKYSIANRRHKENNSIL